MWRCLIRAWGSNSVKTTGESGEPKFREVGAVVAAVAGEQLAGVENGMRRDLEVGY
jgi:hypothetical protein